MMMNPEVVPLLVVRGAARAIDYYVRALGARVVARYEHGPERRVSHTDLALGDSAFAVTEEARAWNSFAPPSLGGSSLLHLEQCKIKCVRSTDHHLGIAGAEILPRS